MQPSDPATWPLVPLGAADWPAAVQVTGAAGWHDSVRDWVDLAACGDVLGVRDPGGVLRGTAARCDFGTLATIAKVVVHPECQRRGLGERLTRATLELPRRADAVVLLVATSFGRPIYARLGFETIGVLHSCRGVPVPRGTTAAVALGPEWRGAAAELDAVTSGGDRRALIARRWEAAEARVGIVAGGTLRAFGLRIARDAGHWTGGPLLAPGEDEAIDVLRALVPGDAREGRVDVADAARALRAEAAALGFTDSSPRDEMTLGGAAPPGRRSLRFAPLSLAYG